MPGSADHPGAAGLAGSWALNPNSDPKTLPCSRAVPQIWQGLGTDVPRQLLAEVALKSGVWPVNATAKERLGLDLTVLKVSSDLTIGDSRSLLGALKPSLFIRTQESLAGRGGVFYQLRAVCLRSRWVRAPSAHGTSTVLAQLPRRKTLGPAVLPL